MAIETLTSNDDLNKYKGNQYTGHVYDCNHPQNYPTANGGILVVFANSQFVITYDTLYVRMYTGSSWTIWRKFTGTIVSS